MTHQQCRMQVHQVVYIPKKPDTTTTLWMKSMRCFRCFYENKNLFDEKKQFKCQHHKLGRLQYTTTDPTTSKDESKLQFKRKKRKWETVTLQFNLQSYSKTRTLRPLQVIYISPSLIVELIIYYAIIKLILG